MGTRRAGGRAKFHMRERSSGTNAGKMGNELVVFEEGMSFADVDRGDRGECGVLGGIGKYQSDWVSLAPGKRAEMLLSDIDEVESGTLEVESEYRMYVVSKLGNGTNILGKIHCVDIGLFFVSLL